MSRSSHLDHPGCGSSLCSLSRLLSSAPGPASATPLRGAQQQLLLRTRFTARSLRSLSCSTFRWFLFFFASLFLALSAAFSLFFSYPLHNTLPLYSACALKTLKETAPRNFPTLGWKSFWVWKLWFEHASGCSFLWHVQIWNIQYLFVTKHQETRH